MQDRAFNNPKIEIRWNTVVTEIVGDTQLEHVMVQDVATGATSQLDVSGLFVAIGHKPNTDLVTGQLEPEAHGSLVTTQGRGPTTPHVESGLAGGDVHAHPSRPH